MRNRSLRRTLIQIVLAATPTVTGGCYLFDEPCTELRWETKLVAEPPPETLLEVVRACQADPDRCFQLCAAVSQRSNIQSCDVEHRATEHEVTYSYTHYSSESGCPVEGRRPPGLRPHARTRGSKVAAHLARSAYHEAASVHAFVDIARQLMRHGAPRSLIRAAQRSAVDEVAHAQAMTELARQRGAQPSRVLVAKPRRRSLEALAIENAREGLVGETWAAMVACWQARQAPSRELRATYAKIAHDELAHAELAVAIDAWARSRLSPAARRRVGQARDRAVTQLARGARRGPDRELVDALGMPSAVEMQQLFANARARLWA